MNTRALGNFMNHPVVVAIGWVAGVAGLPLGIYLYFAAKPDRELSYYVCPSRELLHSRTDQQSWISPSGKRVNADVTSARVMIWNAGRTDVYGDDVKSGDKTGARFGWLLPVRLLAVRLAADTGHVDAFGWEGAASGLQLFWKILAAHSGVLLEIDYEGNEEVPIILSGYVAQQGPIRDVGGLVNAVGRVEPAHPLSQRLRPFLVGLAIALIVLTLRFRKDPKLMQRLTVATTVTLLATCLWICLEHPTLPFSCP